MKKGKKIENKLLNPERDKSEKWGNIITPDMSRDRITPGCWRRSSTGSPLVLSTQAQPREISQWTTMLQFLQVHKNAWSEPEAGKRLKNDLDVTGSTLASADATLSARASGRSSKLRGNEMRLKRSAIDLLCAILCIFYCFFFFFCLFFFTKRKIKKFIICKIRETGLDDRRSLHAQPRPPPAALRRQASAASAATQSLGAGGLQRVSDKCVFEALRCSAISHYASLQ